MLFFVVPGNGSALLGMPDCKRLYLLNINCQTKKINKKEDKLMKKLNKIKIKIIKSKASNSFKNNLHNNNKIKQEIDYYTAGPGMEADRVASAEQH